MNISSSLEPYGLFRKEGKRADGITNIPWTKRLALVGDVTCVDTLAKSYFTNSNTIPGHASERSTKKKHKLYEEIRMV